MCSARPLPEPPAQGGYEVRSRFDRPSDFAAGRCFTSVSTGFLSWLLRGEPLPQERQQALEEERSPSIPRLQAWRCLLPGLQDESVSVGVVEGRLGWVPARLDTGIGTSVTASVSMASFSLAAGHRVSWPGWPAGRVRR